MKKFVVAILALFYLTTSTGATLRMHYCMDKLVDWGLGQDNSNVCSNCGMSQEDSKKGCCKDEHKQLKLQNAQKVLDISFNLIPSTGLATSILFPYYTIDFPFSLTQAFPVSHAPPMDSGQAICLRNCIFRI